MLEGPFWPARIEGNTPTSRTSPGPPLPPPYPPLVSSRTLPPADFTQGTPPPLPTQPVAMGERKVLNKYFAPDFDPENMPRLKVRRRWGR